MTTHNTNTHNSLRDLAKRAFNKAKKAAPMTFIGTMALGFTALTIDALSFLIGLFTGSISAIGDASLLGGWILIGTPTTSTYIFIAIIATIFMATTTYMLYALYKAYQAYKA